MKKTSVILLSIVAVVAIIALWIVKGYNHMVVADEQVNKDWAQVENQYQRRADLIPNLVATVKGYAAHEQSTLDAVVAARANATSLTLDANNLTEEQLADFQQRQGDLSMTLGRLLAITENYPDLKANQNFLELQSQLEGTENRITVARNTFNASAQAFNAYIRRFPNNIIASMFGFEKKAYFQANEGAELAPTVAF
ncbi:MAG: LemA family protein [Paludibacteraceae bacterium]|nr:LemA family protein [Paludibacteraceae bacterium]